MSGQDISADFFLDFAKNIQIQNRVTKRDVAGIFKSQMYDSLTNLQEGFGQERLSSSTQCINFLSSRLNKCLDIIGVENIRPRRGNELLSR